MPASHYEVLNLPSLSSSPALTPSALKAAYRRALLLHHPDKKATIPSSERAKHALLVYTTTAAPRYTIDQITLAYNTLSNPKLRAEYDRSLRLQASQSLSSEPRGNSGSVTDVWAGLESIDLEDMQCDETQAETIWWRGCRCGNDRGFVVREEDLEAVVQEIGSEKRGGGNGEIVVGCLGCSVVG